MTMTEPGDRPPRTQLERAPGERYRRDDARRGRWRAAAPRNRGRLDAVWPPLAVVVGGAIAYTLLGGVLSVTAGLVIVAAFVGWLIGRLVSPPRSAALVGVVAIVAGLLGSLALRPAGGRRPGPDHLSRRGRRAGRS